jgi:hypothetical protein
LCQNGIEIERAKEGRDQKVDGRIFFASVYKSVSKKAARQPTEDVSDEDMEMEELLNAEVKMELKLNVQKKAAIKKLMAEYFLFSTALDLVA